MGEKFVVVKIDDIHNYLDEIQQVNFVTKLERIEAGRVADGKRPQNKYIVINQDEPYAPEVIEIMKKHGHWD